MKEVESKGHEDSSQRTKYSRRPWTRPTSKLRLKLKARMNPRLKEPIVIHDKEGPASTEEKNLETLATVRTSQKQSRRITRAMARYYKLSLLTEAAEAMDH